MATARVEARDVFDELVAENRRLVNQLSLAHKLCQLVDQFRDNLNDFCHRCQCDDCLEPKSRCHQLQSQYQELCDEFRTVLRSDGQLSAAEDRKSAVDPIRVFVDEVLAASPDETLFYPVVKSERVDQVMDVLDVSFAEGSDDYNINVTEIDESDEEVVTEGGVKSSAKRVAKTRVQRTDQSSDDRTKCEQCLQTFGSTIKLSKHIRKAHRDLYDRLTQKFICTADGCGLQFKKFCSLLLHKTRHFGEKQFKCADTYPDCEWSFYTAGELRNHQIGAHSPQQLFHCDWIGCNECFKIKSDLDIHKTYKHNDSETNLQLLDTSDDAFNNFVPNKTYLKIDFNCHYSPIKHTKTNNILRYICNYRYCEFKAVALDRIVDHIQRLHYDKSPMKCEECDDMFWTQKELINHIKPNHSSIYDQTSRAFKCNQCSLTFDKYCKLTTHRLRHSGDKKFKCSDQFPDCQWSFYTIGELKNHQLWAHSPDLNFVCDWADCGKRFKLKNLLEHHKLIHTGQQPFKCIWPGCESKFVREPALRLHITSHTGVKDFVCDWPECGHAFRSKSNLRMHYTSHINDRRFQCEWPGCESRFLNKIQLRRHYLCHKSVGDFACPWDNCGKKLKSKFSLNLHLMAHRGEKPVKCAALDCDMRFTERSQMRKHFKRKHLNIRCK